MILTVDGLRHGQLVRSIAGRDKDTYYLLWDTFEEKFIEVVNGLERPVNKPKKKNLKHIKITMLVATEVEEAISRGELVKNSQIVAAIKRRKNELEEGDRFHG